MMQLTALLIIYLIPRTSIWAKIVDFNLTRLNYALPVFYSLIAMIYYKPKLRLKVFS